MARAKKSIKNLKTSLKTVKGQIAKKEDFLQADKTELQIMDFADGNLKGKDKDKIQKLILEDSQAQKLYQVYLKTSLFNGVLKEVNKSNLPKNLREKLNEIKVANKKISASEDELLDEPAFLRKNARYRILTIGVGGAGGNIVDRMKEAGIRSEFYEFGTDSNRLKNSNIENTLLLGPSLTKGLGAGNDPKKGRKSAQEVSEKIESKIRTADLIFLIAGMGGGTGSGAIPVVAKIAKKLGITTYGIVAKPFDMEGKKKQVIARNSINELEKILDNLIVIPNQNIFHLAKPQTSSTDALQLADNAFVDGVKGIIDLIVNPGIMDYDLEDVRAIMSEKGKVHLGTGIAEGENRVMEATEIAISNPLTENNSMKGAKGLIINVTCFDDTSLHEVDLAINRVQEELDDEANIIWGVQIDDNLKGKFKISVISTGIDEPTKRISFSNILNNLNNSVLDWFSTSFFPKLATVCLFFFIVGQISYENIFPEKDIKFRSGVETFGNNEIFKYLDITIKGDKIVNFGGYLKNGEEFKILITAKEKGYLKINFPTDRIEFSSNVNKNEKIIFPKNKLTFKASKPSIFFEIEFKTSKNLYNNEFKFLVE